MRNIVHIDLNAFFAQCEENEHPEFKGKPLAVGGGKRRGVISTANYEARKYGVHSAMNVYEATSRCKDLIIVEGHYDLYLKKSHEFMSFLRERFKNIQVASIDECYIDVTDYIDDSNCYDYLRDLQIEIYKKLTLKCSIGYAHTTFLAKMASDLKKPLGLTIIINDDYKKLIWPLPIKDMYGIGKKTYPRLEKIGIKTIGDLVNSTDPRVKKILGNGYEYFLMHAQGKGNDFVDCGHYSPKSISASRTLEYDETDYDLARDMIERLAKDVCSQAKRDRKVARTIVLTYRTDEFITKSKRQTIAEPTSDYSLVAYYASAIFDKFYKGEPIRLLGVGLENLEEQNEVNMSLFSDYKKVDNSSKEIIKKLNKNEEKDTFKTLGDLEREKDVNK